MRVIIPYAQQYIFPEDIERVVEILKIDWITQGKTIDRFEEKFTSVTGAR